MLRNTRIENWIYEIVENIEDGKSIEDTRVELKSDWINAYKAARQIAGQANASFGSEIIWVIGINEKKSEIVGCEYSELENWWKQILSLIHI